jgi:hypothetical protein
MFGKRPGTAVFRNEVGTMDVPNINQKIFPLGRSKDGLIPYFFQDYESQVELWEKESELVAHGFSKMGNIIGDLRPREYRVSIWNGIDESTKNKTKYVIEWRED